MPLARAELYGAASGGVRIDDPACDLAVAAALASAASGVPPPRGSAFVGEIGLTGRLRAAHGVGQRLAAARSAGIRTVFVPSDEASVEGTRIVQVRHVTEALGWAGPRGRAAEKQVRPGRVA